MTLHFNLSEGLEHFAGILAAPPPASHSLHTFVFSRYTALLADLDHARRLGVFSSLFTESDEAADDPSRVRTIRNRLACLGYDAVSVLRRGLAEGAISRDDLITRMASVRGMQGAAATVTFGRHRENTEMPLYQIRDGAAEYLGESQSTDTVEP